MTWIRLRPESNPDHAIDQLRPACEPGRRVRGELPVMLELDRQRVQITDGIEICPRRQIVTGPARCLEAATGPIER